MKCQEKLNKRQGSRFKLNIPLRLIDLLNVVAIVRSSGPADFASVCLQDGVEEGRREGEGGGQGGEREEGRG